MKARIRKEDHPNNAPGVPMIFPPAVERLQANRVGTFVADIA